VTPWKPAIHTFAVFVGSHTPCNIPAARIAPSIAGAGKADVASSVAETASPMPHTFSGPRYSASGAASAKSTM